MLPTLIVLGISTILNAIYFLKTVLRIYTPIKSDYPTVRMKDQKIYTVVLILFTLLNFALGLGSTVIIDWIEKGLRMFS